MYRDITRSFGIQRKFMAAVVAAIMITALFASFGTAAGSHTATVDVTPKEVKGDSRILFTIDISNSADSPDNIDNIWISGPAFSEPIAGAMAGENIENAGDNLSTAADFLTDAADYLSTAADEKRSAGSEIVDASSDIGDAGDLIAYTDYGKAGTNFKAASNYLQFAGENLNGVTDVSWTVSELTGAADKFGVAADNFNDTATGNWDENTYWMLENVHNYLTQAADNFDLGSIDNLEWNLDKAAWGLSNAGENMKKSSNSSVSQSGIRVVNAAADLKDAALDLETMENNLIDVKKEFGVYNATGENAAAAFKDAGLSLENVPSMGNAGDNLENVADYLNMTDILTENVFAAGENLVNAGGKLSTAGSILMKALGGDYLDDAGTSINNSGENIASTTIFDLSTSASELSDAAGYIDDAASVLKSVGSDLKSKTPSGLTFDSSNESWWAIGNTGENTIAPGEKVTLPVILRTGDTGENSLNVYTRDTASVPATDVYKFTISVDNDPPVITGRVYQSGVGENDLVGDEYNDGMATVEITSDTELSSIGDVTVVANGDNVMPPLSLETTDNITFTAEFDVGEWDDNIMTISIASATDTYNLENSAPDNIPFTVDTRAPVWNTSGTGANQDSGLQSAKNNYTTTKSAGLTGLDMDTVLATENDSWTVNGQVSDNSVGSWSGVDTVQFMVGGTVVETASMTDDNAFSADDVNLIAGLNELAVQAIDETGNTLENTLENVFLDATKPSVSAWTMDGADWTDNGQVLATAQPTVGLTIADAGLGVAYDNLDVVLDNDDNYNNAFKAWGGALENASPYEWADGQAAWENTIGLENAGEVLVDGVYWIGVSMNDNFNENKFEYRSFRIDTKDPARPTLDEYAGGTETGGTRSEPGLTTRDDTVMISGEVEKDAWEVYEDLTVNIYVNGSKATATPGSDGNWSKEASLSSGMNKIEVTLVDKAGNESSKRKFGYVVMDDTPPDVSITAPTDGTTTAKNSAMLEATVTDDLADAAEMRVSVRSKYYTVPEQEVTVASDGSLAMDVPLAEGSNTITVIGEDEAGNVSTGSVTVTRTVPEAVNWQIYALILAIIAIILAAIAVIRRT